MSRPTTEHPQQCHRFNILARLMRWPAGLPVSELVWGALFLVSMLAALALAIWSSIADGPVAK